MSPFHSVAGFGHSVCGKGAYLLALSLLYDVEYFCNHVPGLRWVTIGKCPRRLVSCLLLLSWLKCTANLNPPVLNLRMKQSLSSKCFTLKLLNENGSIENSSSETLAQKHKIHWIASGSSLMENSRKMDHPWNGKAEGTKETKIKPNKKRKEKHPSVMRAEGVGAFGWCLWVLL